MRSSDFLSTHMWTVPRGDQMCLISSPLLHLVFLFPCFISAIMSGTDDEDVGDFVWTEDKEGQLVEMWSANETLYNNTLASFHNKQMKSKAMEEVRKALGCTSEYFSKCFQILAVLWFFTFLCFALNLSSVCRTWSSISISSINTSNRLNFL